MSENVLTSQKCHLKIYPNGRRRRYHYTYEITLRKNRHFDELVVVYQERVELGKVRREAFLS